MYDQNYWKYWPLTEEMFIQSTSMWRNYNILNKTRSDKCIRFGVIRVESSFICFRLRIIFNLILVHRIDYGDMQTQNPRNGTKNVNLTHTQNTQIYSFAYTSEKLPSRWIGKGGNYRVESKWFNKFTCWKIYTSM